MFQVSGSSELYKLLTEYRMSISYVIDLVEYLAMNLQVSNIQVRPKAEAKDGWIFEGRVKILDSDCRIVVMEAARSKCPRCWMYTAEAEEKLCSRCNKVFAEHL